MTARRRSRFLLPILAALLFVGGATWWLASGASDGDDAETSTPRPAAQAMPRRRSRAATPTATTPDVARQVAPPATPRDDDADWFAKLKRLLEAGTTEIPESILAAAGKDKPPGGGLHEVLRRADEELKQARTDAARRRAQELIALAIENAMRPYRQDRAKFAALYREVRFGEGKLDSPGGSLVRSFQFWDAADRIDDIRGRLQTWCYDALALRASRSLRNYSRWWSWYRTLCAARGWNPPPSAASAAAKTITPAAMFGAHFRPHLDDFDLGVAAHFGRMFADLGDPDAAAECVERARRAPTVNLPAQVTDWFAAMLRDVDYEIEAFRELRSGSGLRLPETADGLGTWFAKRRVTDVAHAIGSDGPIEMGEWDDAMTASFLEGGLPWAPEQWQAERARLAEAREDSRDGIRGVVVKSPNWEVFTDVSSDFAAQSTLVLESAWLQAQDGLGLGFNGSVRVGARIYARRADYRAVTHDNSGGHWVAGMNSILTFLDDPQHDEFPQFRYPTLVHEATHAALAYGVGAVPAWMNEGLACYVERWNPTRSMAVNVGETKDWVRRPRTLEAARDAGRLPSFDELPAIKGKWDVDDFGPITSARYAAAESLFVYLSDDPEHWKLVGAWIETCRKRQDPAPMITAAQRAEIAKGWGELVEFVCGRLSGR